MESETREKLRTWVSEVDKLAEDVKERESEVWCLSALAILGQDAGFQEFLEKERRV